MRYLEFRNLLKNFTVFSLRDIERISGKFHRRRLNEWQDKGYIKKIRRNYYIFSDLELNENVLFEIANKIYFPSYISFETALSYYQLIPESIYTITSCTSRKTYTFKTTIAQFIYRKLNPRLFFGYNLINNNGKYFNMASIEKSILDYLYINPNIKKKHDFASLRINNELFLEKIDENKIHLFLDKFAQKLLSKRTQCLMEFIKNA